MANLKNTKILDTELKITKGDSNNRPSPSNSGILRYNTVLDSLENSNGFLYNKPTHVPVFASGGIISNFIIGNQPFVLHAFTEVGTSSFVVEKNISVDILCIGGGGGGGAHRGGGGGSGEVTILENQNLSPGTYQLAVGAGGAGGTSGNGTTGSDSFFDNTVSKGGGYGAVSGNNGGNGGSGGGAGNGNNAGGTAIPNQGFGNNGASAPSNTGQTGSAAGGGGAGREGRSPITSSGTYTEFGHGGLGLNLSNMFGTLYGVGGWFAGGGGGGNEGYQDSSQGGNDTVQDKRDPESDIGAMGRAGAGNGGRVDINTESGRYNNLPGDNAVPNTGSGGGGGNFDPNYNTGFGGNGGSGIILIRYTGQLWQI